jgi:ERCC4-related helicase
LSKGGKVDEAKLQKYHEELLLQELAQEDLVWGMVTETRKVKQLAVELVLMGVNCALKDKQQTVSEEVEEKEDLDLLQLSDRVDLLLVKVKSLKNPDKLDSSKLSNLKYLINLSLSGGTSNRVIVFVKHRLTATTLALVCADLFGHRIISKRGSRASGAGRLGPRSSAAPSPSPRAL